MLLLRKKIAQSFEHIFPLSKKISHVPIIIYDSHDEHVPTVMDEKEISHDELRKSKRQIKEFFFWR